MGTDLFPLLKTRYTQLGGLRLVRQYAKAKGNYDEYILNNNANNSK